jgi:putative tricarboxylic transport membrane protein
LSDSGVTSPPAPGISRALVHRIDAGIALVLIALCAWLYYETGLFDDPSSMLGETIGPEFFPRLMLWLIGGLALIMPFEHRVIPGAAEKLARGRDKPIGNMAYYSIILLVLIVASMSLLGVALSMVFACISLPLLWGERRWKLLVPFAIFFPTVITVLFAKILKVFFYPGLIGFTLA